jgi:hypothetical protein
VEAPDEDPAARPTPNVLVAMHLQERIPTDRTIVWTAAFQAAWDALTEEVRAKWHVAALDLGPPAPPEAVRALAAGRLAAGVVDPEGLTVIAGPATQGTWSEIDEASDSGRPAGTPPPNPSDLAAFARLRASIRYETPFHVETRPLVFGQSRTKVRSYGLEASATGPIAARRIDQVDLHVDRSLQDEWARKTVVVLKGSGGARVVVSGRPPKATLGATWNDVASAIRRIPAEAFSSVDRLAIPRVSIVAARSFDELVGAEVVGLPGSRLAVAREEVRLTADEKGAEVDAEAVIVAVGAESADVVFDGAFLLAMLAPRSDVPYAIAWIGSADGLSPWGEPVGRSLTAQEAKPFAGSWRVDPERSGDATFARQKAALARSPPSWAPTEEDRQALRREFAAWRFDLDVAPDGTASFSGASDGAAPERPSAALVRDGARVVLSYRVRHAPPAPGKLDPDHVPETEERYTVRREQDSLVLASLGGGLTIVLVRR